MTETSLNPCASENFMQPQYFTLYPIKNAPNRVAGLSGWGKRSIGIGPWSSFKPLDLRLGFNGEISHKLL